MISGRRIYSWAEDLFPICRSLSGNGVRQSLKYLKKILPKLRIKKFSSGLKVYDWTVPDEWLIKDAYIKNINGEKVVDFKKNNLHVLGYSSPINKKIKRDHLLKKLYYLKNKPDAIPYVTSYYKRRWGFCVQFNLIKKLKDKYYFIKIDSAFKNSKKGGVLNYGELLIKGKSKKEVLISTNICHPSLANNELSGVLIATSLGYWLTKKKLNYSYRILYLPETIGSISYIKKNLNRLKKNIIAGFQVVCVGDNNQFSYLPSRCEKSLADLAAQEALKSQKVKYKRYSFLERGSDERQYCSPGVDLPVCSIMRSKYGTYPEYHNSKDNLNFISPKGLIGSHNVLKKAINFIERKKINLNKHKINKTKILRKKNKKKEIFYKRSSKDLCEPFLTKYNLYPSISFFSKSNKRNVNDTILNCFAYLDGKTSINEISKKIKVNKKILLKIFKMMEKKGMIKKIL